MRWIMTGFLALLLSLPALAAERTDVTIRRADKSIVTFKAEIAADNESRAQGLMFRKRLARDRGMLFIYDEPGFRAFWMKNTLIPLDMLFFTQKGELAYIHANARPRDLTPVGPSRNDICAVLEIAGGQAAAQRLKVGDRLVLDKTALCGR